MTMSKTSSRSDSPQESVKVVVRLRPFNENEIKRGDTRVLDVLDDQIIVEPAESESNSPSKRTSKKTFRFDNCYWSFDGEEDGSGSTGSPYASQELIFNQLGRPLIDHAFDGFNNCIFAYGQTGSGKSFTMMGSNESDGLIPRIGQEIFNRIPLLQSDDNKITVEVSYLEIYNERVRDLLNPKRKNLKVREHPAYGPYVEDLSRLLVGSHEEVRSLIDEGNKTRTVAATDMNQESSRSHAVFTIILTQLKANNDSGMVTERQSRISLVDLAGSERASMSGTSGARLKEGSEINRSLATLGRVISTLSDMSTARPKKRKKIVVPYRDSTLTWLLKDSLGGNSKTTMIATVSPSPTSYDQTMSTLRFADSAKRIKNKAIVNEDPNAKLIRELKEELQLLKKKQDGDDSRELKDQLQASEKLLADVNQTWEQRLARTQAIQLERERTLEELGISLDSGMIGLHSPKKVPHLVNLSEDPLLAECLIYNIKLGETMVTNATDESVHGIKLHGENIMSPHCIFKNESNKVWIVPTNAEAIVLVNGARVTTTLQMHSGYKVNLGGSHLFRFNHPQEALEHRRNSSRISNGSPISKGTAGLGAHSRASSMFDGLSDEYVLSSEFSNSGHRFADDDFNSLFDKMELVKSYTQARPDSVTSIRSETPPLVSSPSMRMSPPSNTTVRGHRRKLSILSASSEVSGEDYVKEREALMTKVGKQWRRMDLMRQVKTILDSGELITQAQEASELLGCNTVIQLMVLDRHHKPDGITDKICVRIMDFNMPAIRIWPISKLESRLKQVRNMLINSNYSHHMLPSGPFGDETTNPKTFIGYTSFSTKLVKHAGRISNDIYSPYTHAVCGLATITLCGDEGIQVEVAGVHEDEMCDISVAIDDQYLDFVQDCATFETIDFGAARVRLLIYAKVTDKYLQRLVSWDEMQEPGMDKSEANTVGVGLFLRTQCLELDETGNYSPTEVLSEGGEGRIVLHQGLQRRLAFSVYAPEELFLVDRARVLISHVRLVDDSGIVQENGDDIVELPSPHITRASSNTGFHCMRLESAWDSSAHGSVFLDRVTRSNHLVVVTVDVTLHTVNYEPVTLKYDLRMVVEGRKSSMLPNWTRVLGLTKVLGWTTNQFELEQRAVVPSTFDDFAALAPDCATSFRARGVSLLCEYYRAKQRFDNALNVYDTRAFVCSNSENAESGGGLNAQNFELLHDCVKLWKHSTNTILDRLKVWDYRDYDPNQVSSRSPQSGSSTTTGTKKRTQRRRIYYVSKMVGKPQVVVFNKWIDVQLQNDKEWIQTRIELRDHFVYLYTAGSAEYTSCLDFRQWKVRVDCNNVVLLSYETTTTLTLRFRKQLDAERFVDLVM